MALLTPFLTDFQGSGVTYVAANAGGDHATYSPELVFHIKNTNSGTNEVQQLTITGSPTGGTYTLTYPDPVFGNFTTTPLAHNANAATIQAALEAITRIGVGNVTVTGTGPYVITFVNQKGGQNVPQLTAAHAFTGGSSPNLSVSTTTPGAGEITVTISSPQPCNQGFTHDSVVAVGGGKERYIGPFPTRFRQSDNTVRIAYSSVTNITVAALIVSDAS